jgi:2-polyprenyl-3-methyl-5-hydroxy-6-metoxy-1,4-benzoquinol methylase
VSVRDRHESLWETVPAGLEPSDFDLRRRFLLDRVGRGERVLDVGCGEGRFAHELARAGASVLGIDVAEEPLGRARRLHGDLELHVVPEAGPWPLEDSSFDVVWAGEVIEHVLDTSGWLSEVRRVLRSGGRLLLSTPAHGRVRLLRLALSKGGFARHFDPRSDHLRFYSQATLARLIEDFGFERVEVRSAAGPPWDRRLLLLSATRSRF